MPATASKQMHRAAILGWAITTIACVIGLAVTRPPFRGENDFVLLLGKHAEYLTFVPMLLFVPLAARVPTVLQPIRELGNRLQLWARAKSTFDLLAVSVLAVVAFVATERLAGKFDAIVPTYHDEFSYLLQAKTFAKGSTTSAGFPERPGLFDQMHVVSGERIYSRYFPGTGLWMAPFVLLGNPWLGHQLAQVLCSVGVYFCGREVGGRLAGVVAGFLFALSPGLVVFSNLLLAHHPTLVGLVLFLWSYLRWMNGGKSRLLVLAGAGLSYAMLCRPMTAAGFALPFGIHFACDLLLSKKELILRLRTLLAMATPLFCGFALLAAYNVSTTGSATVTAYQQYNDIHTPRHVYGFSNGKRGDAVIASPGFDERRRMIAYDNWAADLTPSLAVHNSLLRIESSMRLTLGVLPLAFVGVFLLASWRSRSPKEKLLAWSILSLHVVHIPYWFSGIMHWHYVLESSIAWLLLTGVATRDVLRLAKSANVDWTAVCWSVLLTAAVYVNHFTLIPVVASEVDLAASEIDFARTKYAAFSAQLAQLPSDRPSIVFVKPDDATPQIDYVFNEPGLQANVLIARLRTTDQLQEVAALFPGRDVLLFDVAASRFEYVRPAVQ